MNTSAFVAGSGWLYRFDPRAKILLMVLLCIFFFLPITLLGLFLSVLLVIAVGWRNTGTKNIKGVFLSIAPMLLFMLLFSPFNVRSGEPLWRIGAVTIITVEGALQALRLACRFIGITYVCTLLFATTVMGEIMLALRFWRLPYKAALVVTLSFTYIPFIAESFSQIAESHRLREAALEERKNYIQRLKDLVPTLTSVLVVALRSIPNLAMSLEMRGLGRSERRTSYRSLDSYTRLFTDFVISITIVTMLWLIFKA
ncbi:MAG: energy-coupling factor transporter transmembrane component T [Sphaerochaeta sp.]|jgi:energy-coupling factor transport system permease protein|nr:energy-coupling factor transporter transmembrane component T [Sphaerochaeta sp.]